MGKSVIYDWETLGQNFETSPVLSIGVLKFDEDRFLSDKPYSYDELLNNALYLKFDVMDQIKTYGKKVEKSTMEWWESQGEEAKVVLKPSSQDIPITDLKSHLDEYVGNYGSIFRTWSRGNTFDPMFMRQIMRDANQDDPFPWWTIRDTRSFLDALLIGLEQELKDNRFVVSEWKEKFVAHDARHDIVVDVLRMQYLVRGIHLDD